MRVGYTALSIDMNNAELIYMKVKLERNVFMWQTDVLPVMVESGRQAVGKIGDELLKLPESNDLKVDTIVRLSVDKCKK